MFRVMTTIFLKVRTQAYNKGLNFHTVYIMSIQSSLDSFAYDDRCRRAQQSGVMILIDVENVTFAILKETWISKGNDPENKVALKNYARENQKHISFTNLIKYIKCHRRRESARIVQTYAVALGNLKNIDADVKLKVVSRKFSKSIDDSVLIRIFSEELKLLRLFRKACCRTFVLTSGDVDYFDIVVSALKAGSNVEIWTTYKSLNKAYCKLQADIRCRSACYGSLKIVFLEKYVCNLCTI